MECPHLRESVKVNRDFIKNKKCELSTSSGNRSSTEVNSNGGILWRCLGKLQLKEKKKLNQHFNDRTFSRFQVHICLSLVFNATLTYRFT